MFDDDRWRKLAAACVADSVASQERSRNGGRRPVWQDLDDDGVLALAWALKAEAQAAWNVEPSRAGQCAQALTAMLRARPLTAAEPLRDWTDGIAELAAGHSERALTALSRAGIGFAALGDRQSAAECVVPRLVSLALLGRHDEALAVGHSGLAEFVATGDLRSAGKIEINMASLLHRLARPGEAAVLYRSAAVRLARCGDAEHSVMADIGLANALTLALDFDEALRINEPNVSACRCCRPMARARSGASSCTAATMRRRWRRWPKRCACTGPPAARRCVSWRPSPRWPTPTSRCVCCRKPSACMSRSRRMPTPWRRRTRRPGR
jgi:hypothetical protein